MTLCMTHSPRISWEKFSDSVVIFTDGSKDLDSGNAKGRTCLRDKIALASKTSAPK